MREVAILAAKRSAIGKHGGALAGTPITEVATQVVKDAWEAAGKPKIGEVAMGCAVGAGLGQNPARQVAYKAGLGEAVAAYTVDQVCGSGLASLILSWRGIRAGFMDTAIAGGMESMSRVPWYLENVRFGMTHSQARLTDGLQDDGLYCRLIEANMGMTGEHTGKQYRIPRREQDRHALQSHRKAIRAMRSRWFADEIVPVVLADGNRFDQDEVPRENTSLAALAKLPPVFQPKGTITAGSACALSDGAAAVVLAADPGKKSVQPIARIVAGGWVGVKPIDQGMGAAVAAVHVLKKAGMKVEDIDVWEINEAFAAQVLAVIERLKVDPGRVNLAGGAIALGHPLGASGARIVVTLVHTLRRLRRRYGLATICIGGGQGAAVIVESYGI